MGGHVAAAIWLNMLNMAKYTEDCYQNRSVLLEQKHAIKSEECCWSRHSSYTSRSGKQQPHRKDVHWSFARDCQCFVLYLDGRRCSLLLSCFHRRKVFFAAVTVEKVFNLLTRPYRLSC